MDSATQQKEAALNTDSGMPSPEQTDAMPEAIRGVTKILNECKRTLRNLGMTVLDLKHRIEGKVGQPGHFRKYRQQRCSPLCVLWETTSLRSGSAPSPMWMESNTFCASCHSVFSPVSRIRSMCFIMTKRLLRRFVYSRYFLYLMVAHIRLISRFWLTNLLKTLSDQEILFFNRLVLCRGHCERLLFKLLNFSLRGWFDSFIISQ